MPCCETAVWSQCKRCASLLAPVCAEKSPIQRLSQTTLRRPQTILRRSPRYPRRFISTPRSINSCRWPVKISPRRPQTTLSLPQKDQSRPQTTPRLSQTTPSFMQTTAPLSKQSIPFSKLRPRSTRSPLRSAQTFPRLKHFARSDLRILLQRVAIAPQMPRPSPRQVACQPNSPQVLSCNSPSAAAAHIPAVIRKHSGRRDFRAWRSTSGRPPCRVTGRPSRNTG